MTKKAISSLLSSEMEQALESCTDLPSLPAAALKIIAATKDPDITLSQVSSIISTDPAISAKLLKIANSSMYSQGRSSNNLREALSLLGFNAALTIALSFSLLQSLGNANNINHENYWKRSILSAAISRLLGEQLGIVKLEELFLASLLQDVGILVLQCIKESPYPIDQCLIHDDRVELEKEMLNLEHSVVGAWLLESWNLPEYLIKSVRLSHTLNISDYNEETHFHSCLSLSGRLADVWLDENPGEILTSLLDVVKSTLNIDNESLNQFIVKVDEFLPEMSRMFEISLATDTERKHVLHDARELLLERSIASIKQAEDDRRHINSITDRVEKIEIESQLDHLTKVYNRQHIETLLEEEFKNSTINKSPLSLAFIDIDDFKAINDTYGHLIGDEVIKLISSFFSKNIRDTDVLARYGGDEFLLMLPGANLDVAKSILERLLPLLQDNTTLVKKGDSISASVSVGLASYLDSNFENFKDFITAADEAVYKSKASGKNCLSIY